MHRPATISLRTSLFEDAVAIVENEYASDLSLDDIARRVASSRRQLQRAYSEIGETTFREHLTAVRMDRAAELLRIRGLTVRDVVESLILSNPYAWSGSWVSFSRPMTPNGPALPQPAQQPAMFNVAQATLSDPRVYDLPLDQGDVITVTLPNR